MAHKILVVDDEESMRFFLAEALKRRGYLVDTAVDAQSALNKALTLSFDLIVMDLKLPDMSGIDAMSKIKDIDPRVPIIIITAYGSKERALEAIKKGAYDYFTKPFKIDEIGIVIKRALEKRDMQKEIQTLREKLQGRREFSNIIGESSAMHRVFELMRKVTDTEATVLVTGASGTGKELITSAIHYHSRRRDKPFVKLNCAAIPENLLESELFGYEKGAFTGAIARKLGNFELAHGGTIFLDEIGDMSLSTQAKILRVLQEREFQRVGGTDTISIDVRVIASTNKDLWQAVQARQFREDLYFRLNVVCIALPPLRERREDIPLLVEHFIRDSNERFAKNMAGIPQEALDLLMDYQWPGNVRELENYIERAVVISDGEIITSKDLPLHVQKLTNEPEIRLPLPKDSLDDALAQVEKRVIIDALQKAGGVQSKAASLLKITERSLYHRVKKYNIDVEEIKMLQNL